MSKLLYQNNPIGGALSNGLPIGTIIPYASNALIPVGFFLCNGQAISRTVYKALFDIIGTLYGPGDGENTFNLPNLNINKFLEGNSVAGAIKAAGLPNLTGGLATSVPSGTGNTFDYWSGIVHSTSNTSLHNLTSTGSNKWMNVYIDASHNSDIYGASETVQPSSVTVRFLIKVFDAVDQDLTLINLTQFANDIALRPTRSQIPAYNKRIIITTSQTWTAPITAWYKFTIKGGGGGGMSSYLSNSVKFTGATGGEGGMSIAYEYCEKNSTVQITIGAGGTGGISNSSGSITTNSTNGGTTTIIVNNNTYTATGGGYGSSSGTPGGVGNYRIGLCGHPGRELAKFSYFYGDAGSGHGAYPSMYSFDNNSIYNAYKNATNGAGGFGGTLVAGTAEKVYNNGGNGGNGFCWIEYFEEDH